MAAITVQTGRFEKGLTTEANSLVSNLNKYPDISPVLIDLYPQYQFYWLSEKLSLFSNENLAKDNSFEWKVRGRLDAPLIVGGNAVKAAKAGPEVYDTLATYTTYAPADTLNVNDCFIFVASNDPANNKHVWANPQDMIMFQSGCIMIVWDIIASGTLALGADPDLVIASNEVGVICKVISGKPTAGDLATNAVVANIGDAYGEGSWGGYENKVRETTKRNWMTKTRRAYSITGDAMTNVSWVNYNGQSLWYYTEEEVTDQNFRYAAEKRLRYAKRTMTVTGTPTNGDVAASHLYPGGGGSNMLTWKDNGDKKNEKAPEIGDGLYTQFDGGNLATYTMGTGNPSYGLTELFLEAYVARLAQHSPQGAQGNEWLVLAGSPGRVQFANAMKALVIAGGVNPGGSFTNLQTGSDVALGANFTTYHTLGNKFTLVQDYTLDDPHIYGENVTVGGTANIKLSGTGDLIFLNMSKLQNGTSNISLRSKVGRSYISKYIPGMMNPYTQENNGMAANGFDGFFREWLAHNGVILRNGLTCGTVKAL